MTSKVGNSLLLPKSLSNDSGQELVRRAQTSARRPEVPLTSLSQCRTASIRRHSLCTVLLRKRFRPREVMSELLKLRKNDDQDIRADIRKIIQDLSAKELKQIQQAIICIPIICDSINKLSWFLSHGTDDNDKRFMEAVAQLHMDLVTLQIEIETKLEIARINIESTAPRIESRSIFNSLLAAWKEFDSTPMLSPKDILKDRLALPPPPHAPPPPPRPHGAPPEVKPKKHGTVDPAPQVRPHEVTEVLAYEDTLHPRFKDLLQQAIDGAMPTDDTKADKVIADLNKLRAGLRRKTVGTLLGIVENARGKLSSFIKEIGKLAGDPKAQEHPNGLEGAYSVKKARDRLHDISRIVLADVADENLASETVKWLESVSTREKARAFLDRADQASVRGRSRKVLIGIRMFADPTDRRVAAEPKESDISGLLSIMRAKVRDLFTRRGVIDAELLMNMFIEASGVNKWQRLTREFAEKRIEQLQTLPARLGNRLLTSLLMALSGEAGDASESLASAVLDEIDAAAQQRLILATWADLPKARSPEEAIFTIHDIARQGPFRRIIGEPFRMWCALQLRAAKIAPADAELILKLTAPPLKLTKRSAAVREAIQAFVEVADGPTYQRALVLDHFERSGFEQFRPKLEMIFAEHGLTYTLEDVDRLLGLPARFCVRRVTSLLSLMGGDAKGKALQELVNKEFNSIYLEIQTSKPVNRTWIDMRTSKTIDDARYLLHDIARHESAYVGDKWFEGARAHLLYRGLKKEVARQFSELAKTLQLTGTSEKLRDAIAQFAEQSPSVGGGND